VSFLYEHRSQNLGGLLLQAGAGADPATLLIPELQRPYVWPPRSVILLVDSLLRGWPFGSLLLWNYGQEANLVVEMPHRRFWSAVDRTDDNASTDVLAATLPAYDIRMVLDGQQRVQSLLLAVGGEAFGFKLYDRDWMDQLGDRAPSGRISRSSWTSGQLCLDVPRYLAASQGVSPRQVDYAPLLAWVNTLTAGGESPRKAGTVSALPSISREPGRYIRLSRLWDIAALADNEEQYRRLELLASGRSGPELLRLTNFISRLQAVKATPVSVLEVIKKPDDLSTDDYQDAVVNIFSRLNTQGRALSQEDITFAWFKAHWSPDHPVARRVSKEFDEVRDALALLGVDVSIDALVQAAATVWSVLDRGDGQAGSVLSRRDLVRGSVMRDVVRGVAARWNGPGEGGIRGNLLWVAEILWNRKLALGEQYLSYNALMTLWCWCLLAEAWVTQAARPQLQVDQFWAAVEALVNKHADRWLTVPSWAGRWSDGLEPYTKDLARRWAGLKSEATVGGALKSLEGFFVDALDAKTVADAKGYLDALEIHRRDRVRDYFIPLWFWTRLDVERWDLSKDSLKKVRGSARATVHVDHVVPYGWWDKHPVDDESAGDGNDLGNCMLLHANFNLAKSDTPAGTFLPAQVTRFKNDPTLLDRWRKALRIPPDLLDATKAPSLADVQQAVSARTREIRDELKGFVDGRVARQDV
jgi:hypothetical protein